jgi:hypothetical protein
MNPGPNTGYSEEKMTGLSDITLKLEVTEGVNALSDKQSLLKATRAKTL